MNSNVVDINVHDIKIGNRHRKEMGDIEALACSIEEVGLLQPIGITPDNELVFGERRLRAYRNVLGRKTIPARIVDVPQGQRVLTACPGKDLEHVLIVPTTSAAFHGHAVFLGMLFQQGQRKAI